MTDSKNKVVDFTNQDRLLWKATIVFVIYSILIFIYAWLFDFCSTPDHASDDFQVYWEKYNWVLYPLFFPLVALAVAKSWTPFIEAWTKEAHDESIIRHTDGSKVSNETRNKLLKQIIGFRKYILIAAVLSSLIFNIIDIQPLIKVYATGTAKFQKEYAELHQHFMIRWLYDSTDTGKEFLVPDVKQWGIFISSKIQQFLIVVLGFMVLFQLFLHIILFKGFGNIPSVAKKEKLTFFFNYKAVTNDFGLTYWNRALDNFYFYGSFALLTAVLSKMGHNAEPSAGHVMANTLLLIALLFPIVFSISARQKYANDAEDRAREEGEEEMKLALNNRIWPLNKNTLAKIWISLCFAIYLVYLTGDWTIVISKFIDKTL